MVPKNMIWKKARGKLGVVKPLIGEWRAQSDSPMGKYICTRVFEEVLKNKYVKLTATWEFPRSKYVEEAFIGLKEGQLSFWSFTSDGKNSFGTLANGIDVHPEAICFEAEMPAGIARMIYWPNHNGGFNWAVESKTKKGWNRFTMHEYFPVNK